MKYSIPYKRPLSFEEKQFLLILIQNSNIEWLKTVDNLTVIARCSCNECPTVLFGLDENDQPYSNQKIIAELVGWDHNDEPIEVVLFGNDQIPTELEFISYGEHNLTEIPPLNWFIEEIKN